MGNSFSSTAGRGLLEAAARGDERSVARHVEAHPSSVCFTRLLDRSTPLLVAAAAGHHRVVQQLVEAAVMSCGPERVPALLNHTNRKGQSPLILACAHGHAQVVEYLLLNGANPLVLDASRRNTCLIWAAAHSHAGCVGRMLSGRAAYQLPSGASCPVADIPCWDEDGSTRVRFVDRHNAAGLTALHAAALRGSLGTAAALVRGGADLFARTAPPRGGAACPLPLPPGSSALHVAALQGDLPMVRLLLESQQEGGRGGGRD
ncbi:MAG: ankyrin repeat-containing domain protein, partial [Monoraphidium minutum]